MLHNEFTSQEVYTWSNETIWHEEEKGIVGGKTVGAEGGKTEEGGGMLVKTIVVITHTLSSDSET